MILLSRSLLLTAPPSFPVGVAAVMVESSIRAPSNVTVTGSASGIASWIVKCPGPAVSLLEAIFPGIGGSIGAFGLSENVPVPVRCLRQTVSFAFAHAGGIGLAP